MNSNPRAFGDYNSLAADTVLRVILGDQARDILRLPLLELQLVRVTFARKSCLAPLLLQHRKI
jgi:hypothetical protein